MDAAVMTEAAAAAVGGVAAAAIVEAAEAQVAEGEAETAHEIWRMTH